MDAHQEQAEILSSILDAEIEIKEGKYVIRKKKKAKHPFESSFKIDGLELDVYLECYMNNENMFNRAEIFLLSAECQKFTEALARHEHQLPTSYRQWQVGNPASTIVCMYMESKELPEHFAERLSDTLQAIQ